MQNTSSNRQVKSPYLSKSARVTKLAPDYELQMGDHYEEFKQEIPCLRMNSETYVDHDGGGTEWAPEWGQDTMF